MPAAPLPHGPLPERTIHLCVDMQNVFAEDTPWQAPWMKRVLPTVEKIAARRPERTIFTRFIPPTQPADLPGSWRRYYERWPQMTRSRLDPELLELVEPLRRLVPPAKVVDKPFYSPFHATALARSLMDERCEALVVSGAETDMCVLAAVLDAVDLGIRVVLATDAVCSSSDETHDALMKLYHSRFSQQVEPADTESILAAWS
jgi:nicotinamidase-related amidase